MFIMYVILYAYGFADDGYQIPYQALLPNPKEINCYTINVAY